MCSRRGGIQIHVYLPLPYLCAPVGQFFSVVFITGNVAIVVAQGTPGSDWAERSTNGRAAKETARVPHWNYQTDPRETGEAHQRTPRQVPGGRQVGRVGQGQTTETRWGQNGKTQRAEVYLLRSTIFSVSLIVRHLVLEATTLGYSKNILI